MGSNFRLFHSTNRIRLSDIATKFPIPKAFKAKQEEVHGELIRYAVANYKNTKKYRQQVVDALNILTYCIIQNELPSFDWNANNPFETMPDIDLDLVENTISQFYLNIESIEWNVTDQDIADAAAYSDDISASSSVSNKLDQVNSHDESSSHDEPAPIVNRPLKNVARPEPADYDPTPVEKTEPEDLYLQGPIIPTFDVNKIWFSATIGHDHLVIYTSLPEIPTRQTEISVTTDINKMTDQELMNLYPNCVIHTRHQKMYYDYPNFELDMDPDLGTIIPIEGFTREQVVDNIIKYPVIFKLYKVLDDGTDQEFARTIEMNGELLPISKVWDTLPESKKLPRDSEFVREYVIRRYLLEEEAGIDHRYKLADPLDPFVTLFMPPENYIERGYTDTLSIVKQCVTSRVNYKQSRNPILRRVREANG